MKNMLKYLGIMIIVLIIAFVTVSCKNLQRVKIDPTPDRDPYYEEIEAESRK